MQTAAFLGGLRYSGQLNASSLIVCPVTIIRQWVRELQRWYAPFRVAIVHKDSRPGFNVAAAIIGMARTPGTVLVTSYETLKLHADKFVRAKWDYVFLDEGHKIKNPDSEVTLVCKQLKVTHNAPDRL